MMIDPKVVATELVVVEMRVRAQREQLDHRRVPTPGKIGAHGPGAIAVSGSPPTERRG